MANSSEKVTSTVDKEAIAKTLMLYLDNQEQMNESRFQSFLHEFRQVLSQFRVEIMSDLKSTNTQHPIPPFPTLQTITQHHVPPFPAS